MIAPLGSGEGVVPAGSAPPAQADAGVAERGGRTSRRWLVGALPWVTTVALLALEEILARTGVLPAEVPPFTDVVRAGWELVPTSAFATSLGQTVGQVAVGLLVGAVVGVAAGGGPGAIPLLYRLTHHVPGFLRFIPPGGYPPAPIPVLGGPPGVASFPAP